MELKKYKNRKYEKMVKQAIRKIDIEPAFKKMIPEIFLRRMYELKLPEQQLIQELNRMKNNVSEIRFCSEDEIGNSNSMGCYFPSDGKIFINRDFYAMQAERTGDYIELSKELFSTLTHEVYHVITDREDGTLGLTFRDQSGEYHGSALDEIFTETTANRTSISRTDEDFWRYRSETSGYGDMTFASNIIAATFGKSETEVLRAGTQGRKALISTVLSGLPNPERSYTTFKALEQKIDFLFNINYNPEQFSPDFAQDMKGQLLSEIYDYSLAELNWQLTETQSSSNVLDLISRYRYQKDKIKTIMKGTLKDYNERGEITENQVSNIQFLVNPEEVSISHRIKDMYEVARNYTSFRNEDEYSQAFTFAKNDQIRQYADFYNQNYYGMNIDVNSHTTKTMPNDPERYQQIYDIDFDDGRQWNDSQVIKNLSWKIYKQKINHSKLANAQNYPVEQKNGIRKFFSNIANLFKKKQNNNSYENGQMQQTNEKEVTLPNEMDRYILSPDSSEIVTQETKTEQKQAETERDDGR